MKNFSFIPISLFGSIMGLCGLSVAYKSISNDFLVAKYIFAFLSIFTILVFLVLCISYMIKIFTSFESFKAEFTNPLTKSFFGTFCISLLLIPLILHQYLPKLAFYIWVLGVVLMLSFAFYMLSFWIQTKHELSHITPAWIVPVVGTLDIPLASNLFEINSYLLNTLSLSIGLFFTTPIITLILSRVIFFEKLPQKLMPTLMILVAPFSVGYLAYLHVSPKIDTFALALFFIGVFIFLTLLPQLYNISKCCPFKVTWWAISFPLSAMLNSFISVSNELKNHTLYNISLALLIIFSLIFLWLTIRTISGILKNELEHLT